MGVTFIWGKAILQIIRGGKVLHVKLNCNFLENIHSWMVVLYGQGLLHRLEKFCSYWSIHGTVKLFHLKWFAIGCYQSLVYVHNVLIVGWSNVYGCDVSVPTKLWTMERNQNSFSKEVADFSSCEECVPISH